MTDIIDFSRAIPQPQIHISPKKNFIGLILKNKNETLIKTIAIIKTLCNPAIPKSGFCFCIPRQSLLVFLLEKIKK